MIPLIRGVIMESLRLRIKWRVEEYLKLDIDGIRKFILDILLRLKKVTVDQLHIELNKKFKVSYSAVASSLGYIHSKLGILHAYKESYKTPIVYSLKEDYVDILMNALKKTAVSTS
jgi:DNA-binding transcriptional ArsR family regulator